MKDVVQFLHNYVLRRTGETAELAGGEGNDGARIWSAEIFLIMLHECAELFVFVSDF